MKKTNCFKKQRLNLLMSIGGMCLLCFLFVPRADAFKMEAKSFSLEQDQMLGSARVSPYVGEVDCGDGVYYCMRGELCCISGGLTCGCCDETCTSCDCVQCYGCYNSTCAASYLYREQVDESFLEPFRKYRDNVLAKQPNGSSLIAAYYKFSPVLIEVLERNPVLKQRARVLADYFLATLNADPFEIRLTPQKAKELRIFIRDLQKAAALEKTSSELLQIFPNIKRELQNTKTIQSQN